jgi:hypothetical protein
MTVPSGGRAAQSVLRARRAGSGYSSSSPGAWRPSGLSPALFVRRACGGGLRRCTFGVGEQVPGAGEQLAGDRGGGDLLAASLGDGLVAGGELRGAPGGLRCLAQHLPQPDRALFGDVPVAGDAVTAADGGVSPAQDASLRAVGNRVMSPISARMTSAVNGPAPGSWVRTLTRGSDRARWRISPSSRSIRTSAASISARPSSITSREAAGSDSEASHWRPGPLQYPAGRSWPWSASAAWIRLRSSVRSRTSWTRCRRWRTAGGAIQASGSRSARSSRAKISAPALVVLQPRGGDRLAPQRVHQVGLPRFDGQG